VLRLVQASHVILRDRGSVPRVLRLLAGIACPGLAIFIEGRSGRSRRSSGPCFLAFDARLTGLRRAIHMIPADAMGRALAGMGRRLAHVALAHGGAVAAAARFRHHCTRRQRYDARQQQCHAFPHD